MNTQTLAISITGRHLYLTDGMKDYAHRKLEHVAMEFPALDQARLVLDVQKHLQRCSVTLRGANGLRFQAHCETDNMYASIDRCMEKLANQIRKHHTRTRHFHERLDERRRLFKSYAFRPNHHRPHM